MSQQFEITMETGDLSQFTSTTTGSGNTLDAFASAAKVGSYGLRTIMANNANATYGQKDSALTTPNFRLGAWLYIPTYTTQIGVWFPLRWLDSASLRGQVQIQRALWTLRFRMSIKDDVSVTQYSGIPCFQFQNWIYLEVAITRASSTSASNGKAVLYANGWPIAKIDNLDVYDTARSPNEWRFGADNPTGAANCTVYMDNMELDDDETTDLYGAKAEPFFARDFEDVDQNEKVGLQNSGTTATFRYNAADALNGTTIGTSIDATGSSGDPRWDVIGIEEAAAGAVGFAVRFWMDVSNISQGANEDFDIFRVITPDYFRWLHVEVEEYDATYIEMRIGVYDDGNVMNYTSHYLITKADAHKVTVIITYATDTSSADGSASFYVDGTLKETLSSLDIFDADKRPEDYNFGYRSGSATMTGRIKIDEIIIRHDNTDPDAVTGLLEREYPRGIRRGICRGVK